MKRLTCSVVALAATQVACTHRNASQAQTPLQALHWLEGCWHNDSGVEETWVRSQHGDQLFGYSVNVKDNQRVFFETLRIDISRQQATLFAYPKGIGPTPFEATLDDPLWVEFTNSQNDYPQRIRYTYADDQLVATISLMDNSNINVWNYERCE